MEKFKVFQVYYEEGQDLYKHRNIIPVYNPVPNKFKFSDGYFLFENKIILDKITEDIEAEYVGVWSHKHYEKIWGTSEDEQFHKKQGEEGFIKWFENKVNTEQFDVLGFHRKLNNYHKTFMITAAERFHPNFKVALDYIVKKANLPVNLKPPFSYVTLMNYQIAKKSVYLQYIDTVLRPAIDLMMDAKETQLQKWLFSDANYEGDAKHNGTLQKISGTNHYTMHTFILERLFTLFLNANRHYKCINY